MLASWTLFASDLLPADQVAAHCRTLLEQIAGCVVADRPGRVEPRVLKRRRHRDPLMPAPPVPNSKPTCSPTADPASTSAHDSAVQT